MIHAVVPVKDLVRAKSRLAEVLSPTERRTLVLTMFQHVLTTVQSGVDHRSAACIKKVWVSSADPTVRDLAASMGVQPLVDVGLDLNIALERARAVAMGENAEALLIIPADVATIRTSDVEGLVQSLAAGSDLVLTPDQSGSGTNALGIRLPSLLHFQFGPHSFADHLHTARRLGLNTQVFRSPTLALDIDTPEDLAQLQEYIWQP